MILRLSEMIKFMFEATELILVKNNMNQSIQCKFLWHWLRNYRNDGNNLNKKEIITTIKEKQKFVERPKSKVIYPNKSETINIFEGEEKLAAPKNFHLVKPDKFLNKQPKGNTEKAIKKSTQKLFNIKSNITNNDLIIKINNINKLLKKNCHVQILLKHPDGIKGEVLQNIKEKVQGSLLTEKQKNMFTILNYSPLLNNTDISLKNDDK